MKKTIIILILIVSIIQLKGQSNSLTGLITDISKCNSPVPLATVILKDLNGKTDSIESDFHGIFHVNKIKYEQCQLRIEYKEFVLDTVIYTQDSIIILIETGYKGKLHLKYDEKKKKYGYVGEHGEFIIKPQYKKAEEFNDCIAKVYIKEWRGLKRIKGWFYINKNNEIVMPPRKPVKAIEVN